jgi:hypothetical protein
MWVRPSELLRIRPNPYIGDGIMPFNPGDLLAVDAMQRVEIDYSPYAWCGYRV